MRPRRTCSSACASRARMGSRFSIRRRWWRFTATRSGIPRVINLLCEHCLVSAFVDQQKMIGPAVVDGVARDFDLGDNTTSALAPASARHPGPEKFDLVDALRSLATLADRLRQEEQGPPRRKETMSRIHEALKKAEQERAAIQGGAAQPSFATTPVADPPVFADAPASMPPAASPARRRCRPLAARSAWTRCWLAARRWSGSRILRPCCS